MGVRQRLGYLAWHGDAERRHKRGERQLYCGQCQGPKFGGWVWPDECDHLRRLTSREFAALVRAAKLEAGRHDTDEKRYGRAMRRLLSEAGV